MLDLRNNNVSLSQHLERNVRYNVARKLFYLLSH